MPKEEASCEIYFSLLIDKNRLKLRNIIPIYIGITPIKTIFEQISDLIDCNKKVAVMVIDEDFEVYTTDDKDSIDLNQERMIFNGRKKEDILIRSL